MRLALSVVGGVPIEPATGTPLEDRYAAVPDATDFFEDAVNTPGLASSGASAPGANGGTASQSDQLQDSSEENSLPRFHVPWASGETFTISQGNNGSFSHRNLFAWDIPMPEGTPIVAVAAGIIVDRRKSSTPVAVFGDSGAPENFVAIDHGNGLKSVYSHLAFDGVLVAIGDHVAAGQAVGLSGHTGYSTAPHLHFEVRDVANRSIATGFIESIRPNGVALVGDELTSQNEYTPESVEGLTLSKMPLDAFAENDIELMVHDLPGFLFETDIDYEIRGRVLSGDSRVCAALVDPISFTTVRCDLHPVADDGTFTLPLQFAAEITGRYWFGVISGNGAANGLAPVRVHVTTSSATD